MTRAVRCSSITPRCPTSGSACKAEILPDDFEWHEPVRRMVLRYLGPEGMAYAESTFDFPRVAFKVWPVKQSSWNGGGFDRTFHRETVWHESS